MLFDSTWAVVAAARLGDADRNGYGKEVHCP